MEINQDAAECIFSILPFGVTKEFDITGWETEVAERCRAEIVIVEDGEVESDVLEIMCDTFYKAAVSFPDDSKMIGSPFPFITFHLKNMNRYTAVEVEIEDKKGQVRTIRSSNAQSVIRQRTDIATLPMKLKPGWNSVVLDVQALTQLLFGTDFKHAIRVRVFANCRVRRIYFHERMMKEHELPESMRVLPEITMDLYDNGDFKSAKGENLYGFAKQSD